MCLYPSSFILLCVCSVYLLSSHEVILIPLILIHGLFQPSFSDVRTKTLIIYNICIQQIYVFANFLNPSIQTQFENFEPKLLWETHLLVRVQFQAQFLFGLNSFKLRYCFQLLRLILFFPSSSSVCLHYSLVIQLNSQCLHSILLSPSKAHTCWLILIIYIFGMSTSPSLSKSELHIRVNSQVSVPPPPYYFFPLLPFPSLPVHLIR